MCHNPWPVASTNEGEYVCRAPRATFTAGLARRHCLYSLPKCLPRRANWAQDLCKRPSVLPYPAPPEVKIDMMAPWEQPPP